MKREVDIMSDCPFINKVARDISDPCFGFANTCNLMDGDACLKKDCPLQKEGKITIKWTGE